MSARKATAPMPATMPTTSDSAHNTAGPIVRVCAVWSSVTAISREPFGPVRIADRTFVQRQSLSPSGRESNRIRYAYLNAAFSALDHARSDVLRPPAPSQLVDALDRSQDCLLQAMRWLVAFSGRPGGDETEEWCLRASDSISGSVKDERSARSVATIRAAMVEWCCFRYSDK